jgi:hypothetical protein
MSEASKILTVVRERLRAGELQNSSAPKELASHPDAGLLTAFAEGTLTPRSRNEMLAHLAVCADCRTVLVLRQPEEASAQLIGARFQLRTVRWRAIGWAVLAASLALAIGLTSVRKLSVPSAPPNLEAKNEITKSATVNSKSASENPALTANTANAPVPPQLQGRLQDRDHVTNQKLQEYRAAGQAETVSKIAGPAAALKEAPGEQASLSRYDEAEKKQTLARNSIALGAPAAVPPAPRAEQPDQEVEKDAHRADARSRATGAFAEPKQDSGMTYLGQARTAPQAQSAAAAPALIQDRAQAESSNVAAAKSTTAIRRELAISKASDLAATSGAQRPALQWRVYRGKVQRALSGSESWVNVVVPAGILFHAVVAVGNQIWVGGSDHGLQQTLFHSVDGGENWQGPIRLQENGVSANGTIEAITFDNPVQGKLRMSSGELWVTTDAGKTWTKK